MTPCFPQLPSHFLPAFSLLQYLWWLHVPPAVCGILGSSSLCTLPCLSELSPSTNLCLLFMQVSFKSPWLCFVSIYQDGNLVLWCFCLGNCSVASRSSAWLRETLMFSLHQGGSTFPDCLLLELTVNLFPSLHPQVYLSCSRGVLYKVYAL